MIRRARWAVALTMGFLALPAAGLAQAPSGEGPPDEQSEQGTLPVEVAEARSLFEAGQAAFGDGRFEDALTRWREAYELTQVPELRYNIAAALDRLGRTAEAADEYEAFLREMPEAENRNYVQRRIDVIREQLASEEAEEADDEVDTPEEATAPPVEATPAASAADPTGPAILFGLAGATLVGAIVTAVLAEDRYGGLAEACPNGFCGSESAGDIDSLRALTITTDVLFGVSAASAAAALLWLLIDSGSGGEADAAQVGGACGPDGCYGTVRGTF